MAYPIESDYFRLLYEYGVIGVGFFLVLIGQMFVISLKLIRGGQKHAEVLGLMLVWFMVMALFVNIVQEILLWYVVGILLVSNTAAQRKLSADSQSEPPLGA